MALSLQAASSSKSLSAFSEISLHFLSGNEPHALEGPGRPSWTDSSSVVAILTSDQKAHVVDFLDSATNIVGDKALRCRCYLQQAQFFKVGAALQMWVVEDSSTSCQMKEATYSRTFALRFKSEEASQTFYNSVLDWKNRSTSIGSKMCNGSIEPKLANKFEQKIEASSAKMYFHYYGQLLHQQNMLQDYIRTGTYYAAIMENYVDFQGCVVVDVGAGSGILSLFAAQAGAKHVYAVEASSMAEYAQKLISGNPVLAQRITVIHGKVEEVELPEKADILISEPMGTLLVNERMLESYIIARDRFLSPNGKMFPGLGRIHMAPFSDEYLFVEVANKALFWQQQSYYGIDLTSLHGTAFQGYFSQPVVDAFDPRVLIAPPAVHTIDFLSAKEEDLYEIDIPLQFTATMAARVHGLACWFDVLFNGSAVQRWLTTAPGAPTTHWYQLRCVLSQPLYVMAGQPIAARLHLVAHSAQSYTIHLTMSAMSWGAGAGQVLQTSSGKLDLKEPYYRMSQPQAYAWAQEQQQQQPLQPQQSSLLKVRQTHDESEGALAQSPQATSLQQLQSNISEPAELLQVPQMRQQYAISSIIHTGVQSQQQSTQIYQQQFRS